MTLQQLEQEFIALPATVTITSRSLVTRYTVNGKTAPTEQSANPLLNIAGRLLNLGDANSD